MLENLNWLAEVAISSKGLPSVPSSPLNSQGPHSSHSSPRGLYHPSMAADISGGQRMYSPRFSASSSPTYIPYPTPNSPMTSLNAMNGVRGSPSSAHFGGSFVSNFNAYQQFSPTSAQNAISPFLVPNQLSVVNSVANTRPQTFTTGMESYQNSHHNPHNAILSANSSSIASQSGLSTSSRSPSLHSSDSSSLLSSGPFSSPPVSSDTTEPQTKSMMRSLKDTSDGQEVSARNTAHETVGIKRKSPSSPELNNTEKNLYKMPFGREGSRKHRILKPPNISILEPNKAELISGQSAPLSAPPIPVGNRQDFLKRIGDSELMCYSNESIVDSNNCHPITPFTHQRRKSVPQTSAHKSLPSLAKDISLEESHFLVPNENCLPLEGHNRLQYPVYFKKGSIIQLGNGNVKRVEEMSTQDFIESATDSPDLCADCSEVIKIEEKIKSCSVLLSFSVGRTKVPVTVEAPIEHPFFVFHKGWSSFSPERSQLRYGLKCRKLRVGDNCVSLTPRANSAPDLTRNTQNMFKSLNKTRTNETSRNSSKSKQSTNRKSESPSDYPLSLIKSSPTNDTFGDSQPVKPSEEKSGAKEEKSEAQSDTKPSATSSSSEKVPTSQAISSSSSPETEPQDSVETEDTNRRHSASDALDAEPSEPSEPSNAS